MRLGIVIVSYQVRDLLRACLQSVYEDAARTRGLEVEVVVVDNASQDGSAAMVAEEFPLVRLVASQENLGFARGNNVGLRMLGFGGSEVRGPKSEVRGPRSEGEGPKSEVRSPRSEVRGPKFEVRSPKSEVRGPRSEVRGRRVRGCGRRRCCC